MKTRTTTRTASAKPSPQPEQWRHSAGQPLSSVDREIQRLFALVMAAEESDSDENRDFRARYPLERSG